MTICPGCGDAVAEAAPVCGNCGTPAGTVQTCKECGLPLTPGAKKCTKCSSFQGWRWWITTIGLVVGLLTGIVALFKDLPRWPFRRSHISASVARSTDTYLVIRINNKGNVRYAISDWSLTADDENVVRFGRIWPHGMDENYLAAVPEGTQEVRFNVGAVSVNPQVRGPAFWRDHGDLALHFRATVTGSDGKGRPLEEAPGKLSDLQALIDKRCPTCASN